MARVTTQPWEAEETTLLTTVQAVVQGLTEADPVRIGTPPHRREFAAAALAAETLMEIAVMMAVAAALAVATAVVAVAVAAAVRRLPQAVLVELVETKMT